VLLQQQQRHAPLSPPIMEANLPAIAYVFGIGEISYICIL